MCVIYFTFDHPRRLRSGVYFGKLLGRTDVEDALRRLDVLIQQEVQMAIAQLMKAAGEHLLTHVMLEPMPNTLVAHYQLIRRNEVLVTFLYHSFRCEH